MTEPYESEKLTVHREPPLHTEPMAQAPPPSATGFAPLDVTQRLTQPYGEPRHVQPHPPAARGYTQPGFQVLRRDGRRSRLRLH